MGWGAIGKFFAKAAPYIAAPFTGGASLAFAPLANAGVSAWNAYDAKKNAEKGLGPSRYDQILDMGGDIFGGVYGATNGFGSNPYGSKGTPPFVADNRGGAGNRGGGYGQYGTPSYFPQGNQGGGWGQVGRMATSIFSQLGQGQGQQRGFGRPSQPQYSNPQGRGIGPRQMPQNYGSVMPMGGYGYNENPMNQLDQRNPNLSQSIFQGRQEAMMNQPWRDPNFDRMQGMQIYPQMGY